MGIQKKVARCFGTADGVFAGHQSEEKEALDLLNNCFKKGISLTEVEAEVTAYLKAKSANADTTKKQLTRVRKYFGPWLDKE